MSVRQDKVQIVLEYITDESKSLAKNILQAKEHIKQINDLGKEEAKLREQYEKTVHAGKEDLKLKDQIIQKQIEVGRHLKKLTELGGDISKMDLSKVAPSQLVQTAKALENQMRLIPQSAPQYQKLEAALKHVNNQLAEARAKTRGVVAALDDAGEEGSAFGRIMETALGVVGGLTIDNFIQKLGDLGKAIYKRAVELDFIAGKSQLVFGSEGLKLIENFADSMTGATGKSTQQIVKEMTDISNAFTTLEFSKSQITQLTQETYKLAAAWSKYNGGAIDTMEVAQMMGEAFAGEVDELAKLGIMIQQDTIQKEMQARGYDKLTGKSYDQAGALVTLEIINRKTKEAQDQLGVSTDNLAQKQNILTGFFKNTFDSLVQFFIPILDQTMASLGKLINPTAALKAEFDQKSASVRSLEKNMLPLLDRHDQLKGKTNLSKIEQNELKTIISKVATTIPYAIEKVDQYGNVLAINTEKAKEFIAIEKARLKLINEDGIQAYEKEKKILEFKILSLTSSINDKIAKRGILRDYTAEEMNEKRNEDLRKLQDRLTGINAQLKIFNGENLDDLLKNKPPQILPDTTMVDPEELKKRREEAFKKELEQIKANYERGEALAQARHVKEHTLESEFLDEKIKLEVVMLEKSLQVYRKYGEDKSLDAVKTEAKLIEIQAGINNKKLLDLKLAEEKKYYEVKRLLVEGQLMQGKTTQEDANAEMFVLEKAFLEKQLGLYAQYGLDKEAEALKIQNRLSEITKRNANEIAPLPLAKAGVKKTVEGTESGYEVQSDDAELGSLQEQHRLRVANQFELALQAETDFELKRLELRQNAYDEQLRILETEGKKQTDTYKQIELDKWRTQAELDQKRIDNTQRTEELRSKALKIGLDATGDFFTAAIEWLGQDEAARKQHASAIKAFQVGDVTIRYISEIQAIWEAAQKNPMNYLFPGAAEVIAGVKTLGSTLRWQGSVNKINNTKFERGINFSLLGGNPHSNGGTKLLSEDGQMFEAERDEAMIILKKSATRELMGLSNLNVKHGGVPLMADGGVLGLDITPRSDLAIIPGVGGGSSQGISREEFAFLMAKIDRHTEGVAKWQRDLKVQFVYQKFKDFEGDLEADFEAAQY